MNYYCLRLNLDGSDRLNDLQIRGVGVPIGALLGPRGTSPSNLYVVEPIIAVEIKPEAITIPQVMILFGK